MTIDHGKREETMKHVLRNLMLVVLLGAFVHAEAQTWPARPIKIIVSQAAGGAPDIICRLITDRLTRAMGQQVLVENRPGSGNVVGAQAAARSAPDGYTFFFATAAALVTNPYTFKSLPYDPARDFVPVAMIAKGPFFVMAHPSVPAKTLAELVAYDKANPNKLSFATDGPRNFSGILAAWLNKLAGTQILAVPYATMPQGVQDTVAGRTQLAVLAVPAAAPFIKRGDLRPLGVSFARRIPGYEDVPTIAETFPGFEFIGWFSLVAPAGTPHEIVQRMNRETDRILKDQEVAQRLANLGFYTEGAETPEALADFVHAELAKWGRIVKEIGIQPE
jgi:tripartite-type tricarboxylate transporter receptor subunit TctC